MSREAYWSMNAEELEKLTHAEMREAIQSFKETCVPETCPWQVNRKTKFPCSDGWHYAVMPTLLHEEYQRRWVVPMDDRWRYDYHMTNAERVKLVRGDHDGT